jgi:hypothetical protein
MSGEKIVPVRIPGDNTLPTVVRRFGIDQTAHSVAKLLNENPSGVLIVGSLSEFQAGDAWTSIAKVKGQRKHYRFIHAVGFNYERFTIQQFRVDVFTLVFLQLVRSEDGCKPDEFTHVELLQAVLKSELMDAKVHIEHSLQQASSQVKGAFKSSVQGASSPVKGTSKRMLQEPPSSPEPQGDKAPLPTRFEEISQHPSISNMNSADNSNEGSPSKRASKRVRFTLPDGH